MEPCRIALKTPLVHEGRQRGHSRGGQTRMPMVQQAVKDMFGESRARM